MRVRAIREQAKLQSQVHALYCNPHPSSQNRDASTSHERAREATEPVRTSRVSDRRSARCDCTQATRNQHRDASTSNEKASKATEPSPPVASRVSSDMRDATVMRAIMKWHEMQVRATREREKPQPRGHRPQQDQRRMCCTVIQALQIRIEMQIPSNERVSKATEPSPHVAS